MTAEDWVDLAEVLEAGARNARHKNPGLASALDAMGRQCRMVAIRKVGEAVSDGPASSVGDTGEPSRPAACGNCGAPGEDLEYNPVDGWSCPACHASDADETGG